MASNAMTTVLPLLMKYGSRSIQDLSVEDVRSIVVGLAPKAVVSDPAADAIKDLLMTSSVDRVADIVGRPEVIGPIMGLLKSPTPPVELAKACPACGDFNLLVITAADEARGRVERTCVHCGNPLVLEKEIEP